MQILAITTTNKPKMLIRIITNNAEQGLLESLESSQNKSVARSILYCGFSNAKIPPIDADTLSLSLKDILSDHGCVLYYCQDKDVFIEWIGSAKEVLTSVRGIISKYCLQQQVDWNAENFFHYFDFSAHAEELRAICKNKIKNAVALQSSLVAPQAQYINAKFTSEQDVIFTEALKGRAFRSSPQIMIVEDQAFSRTLLSGLLSKQYQCHMAKSGAEALAVYARFAPEIILLDVELPDINGHNLASFFKNADKDSYIIMVTANNYESDVKLAKANKVQGFIVKPYNKQKILNTIDNYNKFKK